MIKKWRNISELCENIGRDSTLDSCYRHLKCIIYAPNIGYRAWIFNYKGTLVSLADIGNGHYSFYSAATHFDVIVAKVIEICKRILRKSNLA